MKKCVTCGKEFDFYYKVVKIYNSRTCSGKCSGALTSKINSQRSNKYVIEGQITKLFIRGIETLIDTEDIIKIKDFCWNIDGSGYVYKHKTLVDNKRYSLQRFLMNPPDNKVVDHINHTPLDNRKINLRIVSQSINLLNKTSKNGGVDKSYKGFRARMKIGDNLLEKNFINKEDAIVQRKQWEKEYII